MVFTDPPYNVNYEGSMGTRKRNSREKIANDNLSTGDFGQLVSASLIFMMKYCRGVFYICMGSKELGTLKQLFERHGGHWQSFIIWAKNTFTLSRSDWQNQYEPILYGWNASAEKHYFFGARDEGNVWENMEKLKPIYWDGKTILKIGEYHLEIKGKAEGRVCKKKNCVDVWHEKKPTKSTEHPTMKPVKPVKLVLKAVEASSRRGEIVLDPFGGSGSTMIACEMSSRKCRTMEIDPKYVEVMIKRWEDFTGKKGRIETNKKSDGKNKQR